MRDLVLNDLVFDKPFAEQHQATQACIDLAQAIALLVRKQLATKVVRCAKSNDQYRVFQDQSVKQFLLGLLKQPQHKEEAIFLISLLYKSPMDDGIASEQKSVLSEIEHASRAVSVSYVLGSILISFATKARWCTPQLAFEIDRLTKQGDIISADIALDNVAEPSHSERLVRERQSLAREALNARNFWQDKAAAFSYLQFGVDVESQIKLLDEGVLQSIVNRLAQLDDACAQWQPASAQLVYPCKVTGESTQTMERFADARRFRNHLGERQLFELHARVGSAIRIHFARSATGKTLQVGYIGQHLPTLSDPT